MTDGPLRNSWLRATSRLGWPRVVGSGAEAIAWLLLARQTDGSDFGRLAVAFVIARYLGLIADWGAQFRGTRDLVAGDRDVAIGALVGRRYLATTIGIAAFVLGVLGTDNASLIPVGAVIFALGVNRDWVALANNQPTRAGMSTLIQGTALLGLVLVTTVSAPLCVGVAYALAGACSMCVNRVKHVSLRGGEPVNSWMLLATMATQVQSTADVVIVGALVDVKTAGLLAALYRFPNAWYLLQSVGASTFGAYAAKVKLASAENYQDLQRSAQRIANRLALLPVVSLPVVLLAAGPILGIDLQHASVATLVVMMITSAVITFNTPVNSFVALADNDREYARIVTIAAASNVALNIALVSWGGIPAAASVTLATTIMFGLLLRRELRNGAQLT